MLPLKMTRDMLPNLPDEIFEMFIVPQNEAPLNIFDDHPQGRWFVHFGGFSLEEFNKLRWSRTELLLNKEILHPDTYGDIETIIKHIKGFAFSPGIPADSAERVVWQSNVIKETGRLCAPVVCIRTNEGLKLLDGSHRVVASISSSVDGIALIPLDAWIGEEPNA